MARPKTPSTSWRSTRLPWPPSRHTSSSSNRSGGTSEYHDHGVLFCWPDGRPPRPDTITRRFKKLAAAAGLPEIDLHDVRHSYATAGRDARIDWKALSHRIGHSDVAFTMKQYVQTDLEADRQVANTLAELIIGGSLASTAVASLANPLANHMQKALSLFEKGPLTLVAGEGFEPSTSGL
jgi:Phage integrase family